MLGNDLFQPEGSLAVLLLHTCWRADMQAAKKQPGTRNTGGGRESVSGPAV